MKHSFPNLTLRRFNNLLTVAVIVLALYITLLPFVPSFSWWLHHQAPAISNPPSVSATEVIPEQNTLIIPSLGMKETIYDGASKYTLRNGVWHRPNASSPDKGGNTVLAGHRFTYNDPAVFYNLDKVKEGEPIILYWQKKRYDYRVDAIRTVLPTAVEVEAPSAKPVLTVYTCTPLWSSKYRLVLIAKPVEAT